MDGLQYSYVEPAVDALSVTPREPLGYVVRNRDPALSDRLGGRCLLIQTALRGSAMAPFGSRLARISEGHFRIGLDTLTPLGQERTDDLDVLTVVLPLPPRQMATISGVVTSVQELKNIERLRLPMSTTLAHLLERLAERPDTLRMGMLTDASNVHAILSAVCDQIAEIKSDLGRLPGRSLYKRADLFMRLEAAHDWIEERFQEDPSTPFLAEISHISRAHFIRLFSSFYGISPKQLTLCHKLEEAKRLLRETDHSVVDIAAESGFGNRCAFQRLFRERTGATPLQYRRQSRELASRINAARYDAGRELFSGRTRWLDSDLALKVQGS